MSCNGGRSNYGVPLGLCKSCGERLLETNRIFCVSCGAVQVKLPHAEKKTKKIKRIRSTGYLVSYGKRELKE